jgi:acetyl-CoA acetyltransferase
LSTASRRIAAAAGVATTAFGSFPETDATSLAVQALWGALDDASLSRRDIDALITMRVPAHWRFCELAGIDPDYVVPLPPFGRMTGVAIQIAAELVESGTAEVVALAYGNDGRSNRVRYGGSDWEEDQGLWRAWGMTSPGAEHALLFRRHQWLFGTTTEQLAAVSVAFRRHASMNPAATKRDPITIEDHEASRPIVLPLRLLDYCLINDGGVSIIVTSLERARSCPKPPVQILATATAGSLGASSTPPDDFWYEAMSRCAKAVYGRAGVGPQDVKCAQMYDNFTTNVLFTLEGFGFCGRGEGGAFVSTGALEPGGGLPSNTSGGGLSESYMQGWNLNVEAVRQVRGDAKERQVSGADVVQYMAAAPLCSSVIYGAI